MLWSLLSIMSSNTMSTHPSPKVSSPSDEGTFKVPEPRSKGSKHHSESNKAGCERKRAMEDETRPSAKKTKTSENDNPNQPVANFLSEASDKTSEQFKVMPCPLLTLHFDTRVYTWSAKAIKELAASLEDSDETYFVVHTN